MKKSNAVIRIKGNPAWMPEGLKRRAEDVEVGFRFSKAERKIYRKRRKIPASQWAERHRVITMGSLPGKWKNNVTPYLAGIMDASFFPSVETTILCKAPQTGGSECANNCIGCAIDQDPGPVLYVYPDELTARENSRDRIAPMIQSSRRLSGYQTGVQDDEASFRIKLAHMPIYMAWARSAARLANKPIKYLVFDEVDKYPETAGKREADPISLGEKRAVTYKWLGRKFWKLSTPTIESGPIWTAFTKEAEVVFDFWVVCPDCGKHQVMVFEQIKWPEGERDAQKVELNGLAWYECEHCGAKWSDHKRDTAVRWGEWRARRQKAEARSQETEGERQKTGVRSQETEGERQETGDRSQETEGERQETGDRPAKRTAGKSQESEAIELFAYLKKYRPRRIGFHIPSWLSTFVSLSEAAAAFLRGLSDKNKLKDFNNNHAALPWKHYTEERKEDRILALRDDRPRGIVPGNGVVAALTAGVDTQDNGFFYKVRAWGFGMELESWGVREGFIDSFEALEEILWEEAYLDAEENEYFIRLTVQDAMGHRTSEVYDFTKKHPGRIIPYQGVDTRRMTAPISWSNIEFYPGTKKPIKGGVKLLRADANYFKNVLAGKLEIAGTDPGAFHLHAETTEEYARHMCAEYIDEKKQIWVCPEGKANHLWDCEVMNLVAAEILRVKYLKRQETGDRSQKSEEKEKKTGGWIPKKEGWIK